MQSCWPHTHQWFFKGCTCQKWVKTPDEMPFPPNPSPVCFRDVQCTHVREFPLGANTKHPLVILHCQLEVINRQKGWSPTVAPLRPVWKLRLLKCTQKWKKHSTNSRSWHSWGCLFPYWLNEASSTSAPSTSDFICLLMVHVDNSFHSSVFNLICNIC